jgi:hypothetical protein
MSLRLNQEPPGPPAPSTCPGDPSSPPTRNALSIGPAMENPPNQTREPLVRALTGVSVIPMFVIFYPYFRELVEREVSPWILIPVYAAGLGLWSWLVSGLLRRILARRGNTYAKPERGGTIARPASFGLPKTSGSFAFGLVGSGSAQAEALPICDMASRPRRSISSFERSSLWVAISQ